MTGSPATTAWVVSGAIGLVTFGAGMLASQTGEAAPATPRPAIQVTPGAVQPTATASAPTTAKPTATAAPGATATASTAPSPVTPPSAETPD